MNRTNLTVKKNMAIKPKNKQKECSPAATKKEILQESPSHDDSSSLCDSDCSSPVPFMCTQDGARGENEVVWGNTPKLENTSTPYRQRQNFHRKCRRLDSEKPITNGHNKIKASQKRTQFLEHFKTEMLELNENLKYISKTNSNQTLHSPVFLESDDDLFNSTLDSPKSALDSATKSNKKCLRRNLLSSKFTKPETDIALDSDDSMNEHLIRASQVLEDNLFGVPSPAKKPMHDNNKNKSSTNITNDSFENVLLNMNDSDMERLSQIPMKSPKNGTKPVRNFVFKTSTVKPSLNGSIVGGFSRTNSMPESPRMVAVVKPSTSGMSLSRHNSMPQKSTMNMTQSLNNESPFKCTPEEIKRKHLLAKEKLLAKRTLPFTTKDNSKSQPALTKNILKESINNFKAPMSQNNNKTSNFGIKNIQKNLNQLIQKKEDVDMKLIIERKRQEALMKLQKKRAQNNT